MGHFPAGGGGGGSGTIEEIESTDGSITVTDPTGPITDLTGAGAAGVASFNTRTGAVVPASGDYTVAEVTGAAPLASPALTGSPTAPTKAALTDNTDLATTAYTDTAVAVETTRAETAEALALAKANNLSDVADAGSSRFNIAIPSLSAVAAVATANVNIASAPATIDGVSLVSSGSTHDEVLLPFQTVPSQGGVWTFNGAGNALTRPNEFPTGGLVKRGRLIASGTAGTQYPSTVWLLAASAAGITIDTTAQNWTVVVQPAANIPLNSFEAPTGPVAMGGFNFTNLLQAIAAGQAPQLGQLDDNSYAHLVSGCVWTVDTPGGALTASMTAGTIRIKGVLLTVAAVTSHAFAINSDTYIDLQDNGDGTANIFYLPVLNNVTSPALHSSGTVQDTLRLAVVITTATTLTSTAASINQGRAGFSPAGASLQSSTVAAGSNGNNITTTTLSVAANSMASAGFALVDTSVDTASFGALIQYTGGGGTTTLTGVIVLSGSGTVATNGAVTGVAICNVADMLGNLICPTTAFPRCIGHKGVNNVISTTATGAHPIGALTVPFVVPPGPDRMVKVIMTIPLLISGAAAATSVTLIAQQATWTPGSVGAGSFTNVANARTLISVTSDGNPLQSSAIVKLAAGSYLATVSINPSASAGTGTSLGFSGAVNLVDVELAA